MELAVEQSGSVTIVSPSGDHLDASNTEQFKRDMSPILQGASRLLLDLSHVRFLDSTGLGAILSCLRKLTASGGDLKVCCPTRTVRAVFELARMHRIIEIASTRDEGVQSFDA